MWVQQTVTLKARPRGFHLITDELLGQIEGLSRVNVGLLHLLLQHTSASLTLNENCDPSVRRDMERHFLQAVPDNAPWEHDYEGPDICRRISNRQCWASHCYCRSKTGRCSLAHGKGFG